MITRSEGRELLKDWKTIQKPIKEYSKRTGNPIRIIPCVEVKKDEV